MKDNWSVSLMNIPTAVADQRPALSAESMADISTNADGGISSENDASVSSATGRYSEHPVVVVLHVRDYV